MTLFKHDCGLYAEHAPQWAYEEFGHDSFEKGDMISNTMHKIVEDGDRSAWAYNALVTCCDLLLSGRRWPDEFNSFLDAANVIQYEISRFKYKQGITPSRLYRTQHGLTRDPFIYTIAAAVFLDRIQFIEALKIPAFSGLRMLYRPKTWLWRRALITGKRSRLYEWLELTQSHKKDYARMLKMFRIDAYDLRTGK